MEGIQIPGFLIDGTGGTASNVIETMRSYRYIMRTFGPMQGFIAYIKSIDRPTLIIDTIVQHLWQDEISIAGKQRWEPIECVFYEVFDMNSALYQWLYQNTIKVNQSATGMQSQYKINCTLDMLDGDGTPVWSYNMYDVWPCKVSPSKLSYEDTTISTVACTLNIGKCTQSG